MSQCSLNSEQLEKNRKMIFSTKFVRQSIRKFWLLLHCNIYLPALSATTYHNKWSGLTRYKNIWKPQKNTLIHLTTVARFHGNKSGEGNTQKEEQIPIKLETLVKLPTFTQPENNLPPSSSTLPSLPTHCHWQNSDNVGEHHKPGIIMCQMSNKGSFQK